MPDSKRLEDYSKEYIDWRDYIPDNIKRVVQRRRNDLEESERGEGEG